MADSPRCSSFKLVNILSIHLKIYKENNDRTTWRNRDLHPRGRLTLSHDSQKIRKRWRFEFIGHTEAVNICSSRTHRIVTKTDHILGNQANLDKY